MDEFLSRHARTVLLGDRQCTATSRDGTRCGRASALGQFVCAHHGAKAPLSQQAARERLMMLAEPALDALLRALRTGQPCEVCGRSDADKDPVVVRAAQIVLDRSGFGPSATMQVVSAPNPYEDLTIDELITRLETLLEETRHMRHAERAQLAAANAIDAFVVPEDDPGAGPEASDAPEASGELRSTPLGERPITGKVSEIPRENGDE